MDWKRIGRAAMCFLVICCLLFGLSPIKAEAVALELAAGTAVAVAGGLVVASVIIGLGVQTGAMTTAWDSLVNDCHQHLISEGLAELDGTIKIMAVKGLAYSFAVSQEIIEAVRSFLFASGAIQETVVTMQAGDWYYNGIYAKPYRTDIDLSVYPYITIGYKERSVWPYCIFSTQPLIVDRIYTYDCKQWSFVAEAECDVLVYYSYSAESLTGWDYVSGKEAVAAGETLFYLNAYVDGSSFVLNDLWTNYNLFGTQDFNGAQCLLPGMPAVTEDCTLVTTAPGYTAGTIAGEQVDTEIGYDLWYGNAVEISTSTSDSDDGTDPERKPFWPLPLPSSLTDAHELQQEDVWEGSISTTDPDINPDLDSELQTGTLANTQVRTFLNNLLNPIKTAIQDLGNFILNGIRDIFVPQSDYISEKVNELCLRFGFVSPIVATTKFLVNTISDASVEPPVIYIDLGATRGSYDIGGKVPFVDMTWYAEYKPVVDKLLSALIWVCFCWRVFRRLPGIISGMPGDFVMDGLQQLHLDDKLPSRKAAYEVQRRSNWGSLWRRNK